MKILVTGAAGLIGSHLCDILADKNHKVTGIDDLSFGNRDNINKNIEYIETQIFNDKQNVDAHIKLASPTHVSAEHLFNIGKDLLEKSQYPAYSEVLLNYMREPDVSIPKEALEKEINWSNG